MLRLIFSKKIIFKENLPVKHQFIKFIQADFANKIRGDTRKRFVENEQKDDNNFMRKSRNIPSNEELSESQIPNENSIKEKFAFFKNKATYTFADTGNQDVKVDDEVEEEFTLKRGNDFEYLDQEDDIAKLNEFTNLYKKMEKVEEVNVMVKNEIHEIKSAYEKLKEYLQIDYNHKIIKDVYANKDFDIDIRPHLNTFMSEFVLSKDFLKRIFLV